MILDPSEYLINMNEPANERLEEIFENHRGDAEELLENVLSQIQGTTGKFTYILKQLLTMGYKLSGGHYTDEIKAWAEILEVSEADIITANVSYELAQAGQYLRKAFTGIMGCTSVVTEITNLGLVCVRNLDWDLEDMGWSTITLRLDSDDREIVAVTNPGLVGMLSGMVPGEFSITLNWAPPSERPRFNFGPVFLTRWVLENAADFEEAVEYLSSTPLSSPALFMVCGIDNACVVERTCKESAIRWYDGKNPLIVTNHYMTEGFEDLNDSDFIGDSLGRYQSALRAARRFKGKTLEDTLKILLGQDCLNDLTVQQMAFSPTKALYEVRAFHDD